MFLWRTIENYPLIILKYPPYPQIPSLSISLRFDFCLDKYEQEQYNMLRSSLASIIRNIKAVILTGNANGIPDSQKLTVMYGR